MTINTLYQFTINSVDPARFGWGTALLAITICMVIMAFDGDIKFLFAAVLALL